MRVASPASTEFDSASLETAPFPEQAVRPSAATVARVSAATRVRRASFDTTEPPITSMGTGHRESTFQTPRVSWALRRVSQLLHQMNGVACATFHYDVMVTEFEASVSTAVVDHMNGDHPEDNLLIARAFGRPEAAASVMVGLDGAGGRWLVTDASGESELTVPWPGGLISERAEIRREVVALYKSACEKLGVTPREEHAPEQTTAAPHGAGHPHGAGAHGGGHPHAATTPDDDGSFAQAIREATWGDHSDSEGSTYMEDIMRGRSGIEEYTALVAQHYFVYEALEAASKKLAADPDFAAFHPAALVRLPALVEDLEFLIGADWREKIQALPATQAYADRITELGEEPWLPGLVAQHYTRYLGDLSGGQMIAKLVAKQHGFDRAGIAFYDFTELGPIPAFKQTYREALNQMGERLSEEERARVIDEVRAAYRFNTETFIDMDKARAATV